MNCDTQEVIEKARIRCPSCERDYALYKLIHICNPLLPCDLRNRKSKYIEKYLGDEPLSNMSGYIPVVNCESCTEKVRLRSVPQKNACPKCDYVGFYVADETKLCPVCRIVPQEKPKKRTIVTVPPPVESPAGDMIVPIVKPTLHLHVTIVTTGQDPASGECEQIEILGWTSDSIISDNWYPVRWMYCGKTYTYTNGMQALSVFLSELRDAYVIHWAFDQSSVAKLWLWYLYNKYGPENKTSLGFSL